jgi:multiple sugar transport system permease protein
MSDPHQPRRRSLGGLLSGHVLPLLVVGLFLLPLLWMVTAALRDTGLPPPRSIEWLPQGATLDNFAAVFELLPFGRYLFNSLLVVAFAVPITLITASMAGFAMALMERRTRIGLVVLSIALLMVPVTALWLTRFLLFRWVGLTDSLAALIVPAFSGSSPLFVLLYYWTFRRVSPEIFETARLDGASVLTVWGRIALPLAVPTTIAVAVLTFILYWSDFISPLLYLRDQQLYTLPLGLRQLQQLDPSDWPLMMSGALMLTIPAILFFLLVQRFFLGDRGLGSKGGD